ncbi:unnamed protein product, partial [Brassica rapa subsp. trilocularis]
MQLTTRTMLISFITTINWIRRELSCKSGILQGKSDFGLSRILLLDSS